MWPAGSMLRFFNPTLRSGPHIMICRPGHSLLTADCSCRLSYPLPFNPLSSLVQYYLIDLRAGLCHKFNLRINHLQEELRFAFSEDLEFLLSGSLGE